MRISTNTLYELGTSAITQQQEKLVKTQQQVASGRRVLTPADDPIAAARALEVTQSESINAQQQVNRDMATSGLQLLDHALSRISDLLQDVRATVVQAGNAALSNSDRATLANELRGRLEELLGIANTSDSEGHYLFSGYQAATKPFAQNAGGAQYFGDDGRRLVQVGPGRQLAVTESGAEVFERIKSGNGVFLGEAAAGNAGAGTISPGAVIDPGALTGHSYQIAFSAAGAVTTYTVTDTTTGGTVLSGQPYMSGGAIRFDGIQVEIQGAPANGDQFAIAPSTNQSLFKTLSDLVALLQTPVSGAPGNAPLTNGLTVAMSNLDRALDHTLTLRGSAGSRLKELESLTSAGEDLSIQHQQTLSQLQDVDYARAITELTQRQANLEAAQKSFAKVSGLTLFDYL